jgi:alpha-D-xyloside xylohydrolase
MPVFARAGGIVPRQAYMHHSDERPLRRLLIDVYPGADGSFSLYEDAGEGFAYRRGRFARTPLRWDEGRRRLRIGPSRGAFRGRLSRRSYRVRFVGPRGISVVRVRAAPTDTPVTVAAPRR